MQEDSKGRDGETGAGDRSGSRPQQAGEAGTTRFGMEDGDNTDVPATGGGDDGKEAAERAS